MMETAFKPVTFRHKDGHERTVHTQEALDRFFDNRCPFEWEARK